MGFFVDDLITAKDYCAPLVKGARRICAPFFNRISSHIRPRVRIGISKQGVHFVATHADVNLCKRRFRVALPPDSGAAIENIEQAVDPSLGRSPMGQAGEHNAEQRHTSK